MPSANTSRLNSLKSKIKSLFHKPLSEKDRLKLKVRENSIKRAEANSEYEHTRKELSYLLREYRIWDKQRLWRVTFDNGLAETNIGLAVNLADVVRKHALNGNVLEIGCGTGKTITQLQAEVPNAHYSATGLARIPIWKSYANSGKVKWNVGHAENLLRIIPPNSCDVIFSSLGISATSNIKKGLKQTQKALKPGGILLINSGEAIEPYIATNFEELGFKLISKKTVFVPFSKSEGEKKTHVIYEWTNGSAPTKPRNQAIAYFLQRI
jgi:SAM-dependent methyltransferase